VVTVISIRSRVRRCTGESWYAHSGASYMVTLLLAYKPRQSLMDALQVLSVTKPMPLPIAAAEMTKLIERKYRR
jgi:hypothetical protein